jgi:acyl-coenzyme A thioesterase PaaI-like protein
MPRMSSLELPHTAGCVVCGPVNPHGLRLSLFVDSADGTVRTEFTPQLAHIGFEGVLHGGILSTVFDEAMVWAATWSGRRFCLCGELNVRFRAVAAIGQVLAITAKIDTSRPKLIQTRAMAHDAAGGLIAEATGKYVPLSPERNRAFVKTLLDQPATAPAAAELRHAAVVSER